MYCTKPGGLIAPIGPGDIVLTECFLTNSSWPKTLILNLGTANWPEWSQRLQLLVSGQGFSCYLDGTLPRPDPTLYSGASWIWNSNDQSLSTFMLNHMSLEDYNTVAPLWKSGACAIFDTL